MRRLLVLALASLLAACSSANDSQGLGCKLTEGGCDPSQSPQAWGSDALIGMPEAAAIDAMGGAPTSQNVLGEREVLSWVRTTYTATGPSSCTERVTIIQDEVTGYDSFGHCSR
jgi:hypothetical protein